MKEEDIQGECVAGYKIPGCSESCGEGCGWHIGPKKSEMTDG